MSRELFFEDSFFVNPYGLLRPTCLFNYGKLELHTDEMCHVLSNVVEFRAPIIEIEIRFTLEEHSWSAFNLQQTHNRNLCINFRRQARPGKFHYKEWQRIFNLIYTTWCLLNLQHFFLDQDCYIPNCF